MSYDKNFVPFEEAKKLKELGFDWDCDYYWEDLSGADWQKEKWALEKFEYFDTDHKNSNVDNNIGGKKLCTAPLYSQAFAWLRGDISGWVYQNWIESDGFVWSYEIRYLPFQAQWLKRPVSDVVRIDSFYCGGGSYSGGWNTYEEAELALLQEMLKEYPKTQSITEFEGFSRLMIRDVPMGAVLNAENADSYPLRFSHSWVSNEPNNKPWWMIQENITKEYPGVEYQLLPYTEEAQQLFFQHHSVVKGSPQWVLKVYKELQEKRKQTT